MTNRNPHVYYSTTNLGFLNFWKKINKYTIQKLPVHNCKTWEKKINISVPNWPYLWSLHSDLTVHCEVYMRFQTYITMMQLVKSLLACCEVTFLTGPIKPRNWFTPPGSRHWLSSVAFFLMRKFRSYLLLFSLRVLARNLGHPQTLGHRTLPRKLSNLSECWFNTFLPEYNKFTSFSMVPRGTARNARVKVKIWSRGTVQICTLKSSREQVRF